MIRICHFGRQYRVRMFGKTMCILVTATVSALIVWIRAFSMLTVFQEVTYSVDLNASSKGDRNFQTIRSDLRRLYQSQFRSHDTSSIEDRNFTAVILLTYMRSGSSFTGDILQQDENVFYVFEPLRQLNHHTKTGRPIQWLNGTISSVSTSNITDIKRQALIGWLTCNFSMVYATSFDDWYFFSFGKKTDVYNKCIFKNFGVRFYNFYRNSTNSKSTLHIRVSAFRRGLGEKCLQDLQNACLSSKFRIVKTIRTPMRLADEILTSVPDGKVIHLIRDPRETVLSQARYRGCPGGSQSVVRCSSWHCGKVTEDTEFKQTIRAKQPGRVLTILYEHITSFPKDMTKIMYNFVGLEFSEKISSYVTKIAQGRNVTGCKVCEQPWQNYSNSTKQGNGVTKMSRNIKVHIQNICKDVLKHYGYTFHNTSNRI